MTRLLIDARLGWGSGIGRFVANVVPRVAAKLPNTDMTLRVHHTDGARVREAVALHANLAVQESDVRPFTLSEQRVIPRASHSHDLTWFTNYFVPLGFGEPFIANVHDLLHQEPELFATNPLKRRLSHLAFRHVARNARGVFYLSRSTKRAFEQRYGAPRNPCVVGCGIDHDGWPLFDPMDPPVKVPRLLIVAAAKQHKNFRIALDAFARATIPSHWRLTIVTPDDKLRSSIDLGGLASVSAKIEFEQGLSNSALSELYAKTAVVLMPSRYEGFGLPLAEGLQAGAQCIASTASALVEVGQGARVTYVDPDDLEGWITAIEAECRRFDTGQVSDIERAANMHHALQYRWDDVAERTAFVINRVISRI